MSNHKYLKIIFFNMALLLLISGCAPLESKSLDAEYLSLRDKVERSPEDTLLLGRLADMAKDNYLSSGNTSYRDDAIAYYTRYLEMSPGHLGASLARYSLLVRKYIQEGRVEDIQKIRKIYHDSQVVKSVQEVSPPSFIEAIRKISAGEGSLDDLRSLVQAGVKENPRHVPSRLLLAEIYMGLDKPRLARAMIFETARQHPTNPKVSSAYAEMLNDLALESHCDYDRKKHRADVREAIKAAKVAAKANPKDADIAYNLSVLYESLGQSELAVYQAKRLVELEPGPDSEWFLVDQLNANGQFDQAFLLATELAGNGPDVAGDLEIMAMSKYQQGDYESALRLFQRYRRSAEKPSIYYVMREAIAAESLNKTSVSKELLSSIDLDSLDTDWERSLLRYLRHDISETDLLGNTENACNSTEGHYFIARRAMLDGDREKARVHFEQAMSYQVPRFYEYSSSKLRLQEL
ncbi:MAG: tetratricopeptide repeat protein [Candidatus Thiodiazotropha sp. (ex Monitilora ramsayi)]|nr:tetratricopeptide repeat protein [Candidatus Thiodiazotropha sp. (ex Monitilora ramsayi)]